MRSVYKPEYIHSLLVNEGEREHLPEAYQRDLSVHDLDMLTLYGTQEFIWVLRTCGTFLFPLDQFTHAHYAKRYNWPDNLVSGIKGFGDSVMKWYHFHNGQLHAVTYERALEIAKQAVSTHLRMASMRERIAEQQRELDRLSR